MSLTDATLNELRQQLAQLDARQIAPDAVAARFRALTADAPGLPPRYLAVLERLLQPLDTAAMLGEESCSFSLGELGASLRQWLDHAAQLPR